MLNPIKQIVDFNKKAGLVEKGYNDHLEASFQIEEALEGFTQLQRLAKVLYLDTQEATPKELSRTLVSVAHSSDEHLSDVDRLDKACDAVVFAIGSMAKLGLNSNQVTRALNIVMQANNAKLCEKSSDSYGKLQKPKDFIGPEEALQKILDER